MTTTTQAKLITPYSGKLTNLLVPPHQLAEVRERANALPSIQISDRSLCDLECLAVGAFSPLDRFMGKQDYQRVLEEMRLADGTLFPIPITLPVSKDDPVEEGKEVALRDSKNDLLALLSVEQIYEWDHDREAVKVYGSRDPRHPLVAEMHRWGPRYVSGRLQVLQLPRHQDFTELRLTPHQTRQALQQLLAEHSLSSPESPVPSRQSPAPIIAFQTRNPLHRVHEELIRRALESTDGLLLLHPVVGLTSIGDFDHYTRVRSYRALSRYFDAGRTLLSLLPLAMRFAGPREALWHALIRRNYGAGHLIVGRGHASPFRDSEGEYFHKLYEAQELVEKHRKELGVEPIAFKELAYDPGSKTFVELPESTAPSPQSPAPSPQSPVPSRQSPVPFSSRLFKEEYLDRGREIPEWFARSEVAEILSESHPPRHRQGVCIWFTGLSGSGKSTIAEALTVQLAEQGRQVTVLDGDVVRTHLSKGLGFSAEDRDTNIRRIGFVAGQIARHGGTVICAAISPYRATRNDARNMVGSDNFIEVFVDTPLNVCEDRDVKGLYAKARRGEIKGFTGIDDPYEAPEHPEVKLETVQSTPEQNARKIVDYLIDERFLLAP